MNECENNFVKKVNKFIPSGCLTFSKGRNQFSYNAPAYAVSGRGNRLLCSDGKEYIDMMSSLGPMILGYNDERINSAIREQLDRGILFSLSTELEADVAELIVKHIPCAEKVKIGKNGSDVCMAAVRDAREYTDRKHIAHFGYSGWSTEFATTYRSGGIPADFGMYIHDFEYNNLGSLEDILKKYDCAAIIMEPVSLSRPENGFLEGVRELANRYGAVLIFDEIVCGGRWALGGAQEYYNVIPDMATFGKAIGGGMPISVVCGKKEIMDSFSKIAYSATFFGECLSLAATKATINILSEEDFSRIWKMGNRFKYEINKMAKSLGLYIELKGEAPRMSLNFSQTYPDQAGMRTLMFQELAKRGILMSNTIYITFAFNDSDIDQILGAANESFKIVADNIDRIDSVLVGPRMGEIYRKNT